MIFDAPEAFYFIKHLAASLPLQWGKLLRSFIHRGYELLDKNNDITSKYLENGAIIKNLSLFY